MSSRLLMCFVRFAKQYEEITGHRLEAHYVSAEDMSRLWFATYKEIEREQGPFVADFIRKEDQQQAILGTPLVLEIGGVPVRLVPDPTQTRAERP